MSLRTNQESRGQLAAEDTETFNRWLCVSRIRAAIALAVFFPIVHYVGLVELSASPVLAISSAMVLFSALALRASGAILRSRAFTALQTVVDIGAITLGIGVATNGTVALIARPIYVLAIVPASLVSVPMGLATASLATIAHGLLLAFDQGTAFSTFASFAFLAPAFLFFLVAQQSFVYGAHLREKNAALAALARRLEDSQRRLADEGRLAAGLAEIARTLSATLDDPEPLTRVVRTIRERLGATWGAMFAVAEPPGFRLLAVTDPSVVASQVDRLDLPLASWPAVERLREERVLVLSEAEVAAVPSALVGSTTPREVLLAGLSRDGEMIGFVAVGYDLPLETAAGWASHLLAGIAEHASIVLQNARLLEEVRAASALKSEFVGALSHELRSPLNVVLGYVEMLLDGALGPLRPEQAEALRRAQTSASTLLEMIEALLDLNRIEAGRLPIEREEVSLPVLLGDICEDMARAHARPLVAFRRDVEPLLPDVETDPGKLKTIVRNLLHNAFKFTTAGHVAVAMRRTADGQVAIVVEDTGAGIPPEALSYVFDMFRQVPGSGGGGVGLGLHIVRRLADMMGATVAVQSEVGVGTRFTVLLPARIDDRTSQPRERHAVHPA